MNQSVNHQASCDRTSAHAVRSLQLVSLEQTKDNNHAEKRGKKRQQMYLFQRHDTHQLPDAGDIGVTETQQGEQSVCLSDERGQHDSVSAQLSLV